MKIKNTQKQSHSKTTQNIHKNKPIIIQQPPQPPTQPYMHGYPPMYPPPMQYPMYPPPNPNMGQMQMYPNRIGTMPGDEHTKPHIQVQQPPQPTVGSLPPPQPQYGMYNPYMYGYYPYPPPPQPIYGGYPPPMPMNGGPMMEQPIIDDNINDSDYEVFEDENGEVFMVKKEDLYNSVSDDDIDDEYNEIDIDKHHKSMIDEYKVNNNHKLNNNKMSDSDKGLRNGGNIYGIDLNDNQNMNIKIIKNKKKRKKKNKGKSYANMANKYKKGASKIEALQEKEDITDPEINPDYNPKALVCSFWQLGTCVYGDKCRNAHRFEDEFCILCFKKVGKTVKLQQNHMKKCQSKKIVEHENILSQKAECAICYANIMEKNEKFGILTGCTHAFCLTCIREWRGSLNQSKEAIRGCPICRQISYFILPFNRLIIDEKRKSLIIEMYKKKLKNIKCKHYDGENMHSCPFGTSCFYKHMNKDGTEQKVKLRHLFNDKGQIEIQKDVHLSSIFDDLFV